MTENNRINQFDKMLPIIRKLRLEKNDFLLLIIIGVISFLIRIYYFDLDIPLTFDALNYFFYALDISIVGNLPENYSLANNGWPILLSLFFSLFQANEALELMNLQQLISIIISVLTIIPTYFLCKKFFKKPYYIIGAAIIGFEPHLVQNSLFGISDSLYIFLVSVVFVLFLSSNKKFVYLSFAIASLSTMVRSEGIFLFIVISIIFFVRFKKDRWVVPKLIISLLIFGFVLLPMVLYQTEIHGNDLMFGRAVETISYHMQPPEKTNDSSGIPFILSGLENFPQYVGWNMIPIFGFFVPIGLYFLLRDLNYRTWMIITSLIVMSIPAFYAWSIPLQDGRYLYFLYPVFCVISIFTIKKFVEYFPLKNLVLILILSGVLLSSGLYLSLKIDVEHEKDAFSIAQHIITTKKVINEYQHESKYLEAAGIPNNWSDLKSYFEIERVPGKSIRSSIPHQVLIIPIKNYETINDFIDYGKEKGLTHLVVDINEKRPIFLKDVFHNEEKFPYLEKEFDSKDYDYNYDLKVFKINYEIFDSFKNKD